jgi:hypothetical protein
MKSVAVTKIRLMSRYVAAPSATWRAGTPSPATSAPASAAANIDNSVDSFAARTRT